MTTIDNRDYFITAKHLFSDTLTFNSEVEVEIWQNKVWSKVKGKLLFHENKKVDIAVIDIDRTNLNNNHFDLGTKGMYLSQECFFLGFPFGYKMDKQSDLNNGFPLPFIKKGIISAWITDISNVFRIYLDGHNNPGFSGGPVVLINQELNSKNKMTIIGIVSAYVIDDKILPTPFGNITNRENSGIVVCYAFDHVFVQRLGYDNDRFEIRDSKSY